MSEVEGKMGTNRLSKENAENLISRLFEFYELELSDLEDEQPVASIIAEKEPDKVAIATDVTYKRLVRFAMRGRIELDDSSGSMIVTQHLKWPLADGKNQIAWGMPSANSKVAMQSASERDTEGQMIYFMAATAVKDVSPQHLTALQAQDMSLMECLSAVFFLV